jgi:hypothetical protein
MPVARHQIQYTKIPPHPDGPKYEPILRPSVDWSWGRRAAWLQQPTPISDQERAETLKLMELGDRLLRVEASYAGY